MSDQHSKSDAEMEIQEYLLAVKELEAARELEESEFNRDIDDNAELKESDILETQDPPAHIIDNAAARQTYWQAQSLVDLELYEFSQALQMDDPIRQRKAYYRLAVYHGRSTNILRSALSAGKEPLAQAAMRNLATLHRAMMQMHRQAPKTVPVAYVLDRRGREEYSRDLVVQVSQERTEPLDLDGFVQAVNDLHVMGAARSALQRQVKDLVASGYLEIAAQHPIRYRKTQRAYTNMDIQASGLRALVGDDLYNIFNRSSILGLNSIVERESSFRDVFCSATRMGQTSASLFIDLVQTLLESKLLTTSTWKFTDLIDSPYPRPYQYEAYAVFRGYGYHGQLVEAPTGSGKTMIGMMCIQDWLKNLRQGQSILVLVPTSNYLQQWSGELCYKPIGLRLSPEMVFAGTPNQLERFQKRTGSHPAVLLMTYTALSQAGSAIGKGGFDTDSIEMFLQGANVQYIVLDEVHKVAENLNSVSSDVIRLLMEWLQDGSLHGVIGFTGTAEAYRSRFTKLGLQLVYSIPIEELIAAGFVAPFAELGLPFSYSAREKRIRELLDQYKELTSSFMNMLGGEQLRAWFAEIPIDERTTVGRQLLNMYAGRKDWQTALSKRFTEWEAGGNLQLTEAKLVTLIQIIRHWTDTDLVQEAGVDRAAFQQLVSEIKAIRSQLAELIYLPSTQQRLLKSGFSTSFDAPSMRQRFASSTSAANQNEAVKDELATTIVGLYEGLKDWYRRVGEGRVETIKAVIEAERATRQVSGTIIFDNARRINWKQGLAMPGYEGLGGLYAQLLGDERFQPYAVLSSEQYLPYDEQDPLPPRIASFIEQEIMQAEIAQAMFDLVFQGEEVSGETLEDLRQKWNGLIQRYVPRLKNVRAPRPGEFHRRVLQPMRQQMRAANLGNSRARLLSRLDLRNIHFADLGSTFFDYAMIARYFRQAKVAELEQVSGARQKFFVVPMSDGNRKLLMYDLTSRIVDAESLPINLVIVSSWARTGWNVIAPNLLIDATATRDVTAWQQLRGRAIRARRTWTNDCYRLITAMIGSQMHGLENQTEMPEDVNEILEQVEQLQAPINLDHRLLSLLAQVTSPELLEQIEIEGLASLTNDQRVDTAISLMRHYNKVTHIFELVKAFGSTSQIEFNRQERVWQRRENIAAKHEFEIAVNPISGRKLTGDGHAPLVYAQDPRVDLPAELEHELIQVMDGSDDRIISGWLQFGFGEG